MNDENNADWGRTYDGGIEYRTTGGVVGRSKHANGVRGGWNLLLPWEQLHHDALRREGTAENKTPIFDRRGRVLEFLIGRVVHD